MRDSPGGELDSTEGVRRRCMKNSPFVFFFCISNRTREECDRDGEVGTVHNGRDGKGSVPPRKPKETGRGSCEKDFIWSLIWSPSVVVGGLLHAGTRHVVASLDKALTMIIST